MTNINFVCSGSANYKEVQENIITLISQHINYCTTSRTFGRTAEQSLNFTLFIRRPGDVLMSHGVADKRYFFMRDENKLPYLNRFKHVFVPGLWLKNCIINDSAISVPANNIHITGWPRLELLLNMQKKQSNILKGTFDDREINILWAPTHDFRKRGPKNKSSSTYPDFLLYVDKLEKLFDFNTSLHPRNREEKTPTIEKLVNSDIVISDFGTLVYEAWALGKPVIFPRWIMGDDIINYTPKSAEAHIFRNEIGYHPRSYDDMVDIIRSRPQLSKDVSNFMDEYIPESVRFIGARTTAETLMRIAHQNTSD